MYTHYRGTTFSFIGQLQNDGVPVDMSTVQTLSMKVFDKPGVNLIATLNVVTTIPAQGIVTISFPDTSAWPVGIARIDCLLTFNDGTDLASDPDYLRIAQTPMVG